MPTASLPPTPFPLGPFTPYSGNPILRPQGRTWESANVYNPAAVVVDDRVALLYRAHAADKVSHIGLAFSEDGIHFERDGDRPVLSPSEPGESRGCEDPRVAVIDGTYYLTYTAYDGARAVVCLATSTDLRNWTKHGELFPGFNTFACLGGGNRAGWSKGAAILETPIDGRYLMFFGEGSIYTAWSDDLLHWTPAGQDAPVLRVQPGTFMAGLVETGPQPVMTASGLVLLLHNAAVGRPGGGVDYRCGQALFDPADLSGPVAVMARPWLRPETYEDTHGLVPHVTFVEGLVWFQGKWFAYYGQGDTTTGVAVFDPATDRYGASRSKGR